jgi:hypothetical protein
MIEKYQIIRDKDRLTIKEFAILEKVYGTGDVPSYSKGDFSLRCKENYTSGAIEDAIISGKNALISMLRTRNMYPANHQAYAIADSIIELYGSQNELSTELLFDDKKFL